MLPSGPTVMPSTPAPSVGILNSVTDPAVVTRTIRFSESEVNQRFPSGPDAIWTPGNAGNSVIAPAVVMRPTPSAASLYSVNQRFPSGPATIIIGPAAAVGTSNSWIVPAVV